MIHFWFQVYSSLCMSPRDSMRFYGTEKTSRGNLLHKSMSKGDMKAVMYGILKMVEYEVQMITYSQKIL